MIHVLNLFRISHVGIKECVNRNVHIRVLDVEKHFHFEINF